MKQFHSRFPISKIKMSLICRFAASTMLGALIITAATAIC